MSNPDLRSTGIKENTGVDDDTLMEVAEQLRRQLYGWQRETRLLTLGNVREMLETALAMARASLVKKT